MILYYTDSQLSIAQWFTINSSKPTMRKLVSNAGDSRSFVSKGLTSVSKYADEDDIYIV